MADGKPESFLDSFERTVSTKLKNIYKTPFGVPFAIGITLALFYVMLVLAGGTCLVGLIPPLMLLWLLWTMGERNFRKLMIIGLIVAVCAAAVEIVYIADYYATVEIEPLDVTEGDFRMYGGVNPSEISEEGALYNFTVTLVVPEGATFEPINCTVAGFHGNVFDNSGWELTHENATMTLLSNTSTEWTYWTELTVSQPFNGYVFSTNVTYDGDTEFFQAVGSGPLSRDAGAIASIMTMTAFMDAFVRLFVIYALIVFIIWWTRKARVKREAAIQKWELERKKLDEEVSSDEKKAPSLREAMGMDTGSKDSFVCSECGADVPADATVCPKCGEKFD